MKRSKLFAAILAVAAAASLTYAHAAGMFDNLPIVGGSSYSAGLTTVPAGPTALTGSEKIPADTGLAGGVAPQTVSVTPAALNALPMAFETHGTGSTSVTITNNVGTLFVTTAAGNKAGLIVTMPSAPIDNQRFILATNRLLTVLSFSPNSGQTIIQDGNTNYTLSPTQITTTAGATSVTWIYRLANTTWYRLI